MNKSEKGFKIYFQVDDEDFHTDGELSVSENVDYTFYVKKIIELRLIFDEDGPGFLMEIFGHSDLFSTQGECLEYRRIYGSIKDLIQYRRKEKYLYRLVKNLYPELFYI